MTHSDDDFFTSVESQSGAVLAVLGIEDEQWTALVLKYLRGSEMFTPLFFSWREHKDVRLQLELVRYPVTQLWCKGRLVQEVIGYHPETLRQLVDQYFKLHRTTK